jgi:hypothetical protein
MKNSCDQCLECPSCQTTLVKRVIDKYFLITQGNTCTAALIAFGKLQILNSTVPKSLS